MNGDDANGGVAIERLRFVRLGTKDLAGAADFAQRVLGLQAVDKTDEQVFFRSDDRDHTLIYRLGDPNEQVVGLEVRDAAALQHAKKSLTQRGVAVTEGTAEEAARRKVRAFIAFKDESGNRFEIVVRPLHSGWRYFPSRDAGVTGLEAVALRSTAAERDEALWTEVFNGETRDWVGDAAYVGFDAFHHRLALHPSRRSGVLAVEFAVENVDLLMQNMYFMRSAQVKCVDGPGRRPTSGQLYLTFVGHDGVLFSFVAEGDSVTAGRRPRQFPRVRGSFCNWGSESEVPEFC